MKICFAGYIAGLLVLLCFIGNESKAKADTMLWSKQFGTPSDDDAITVAADRQGDVYVAGITTGSLYSTNAGEQDIFLVKYDSSGNVLWNKQIGTPSKDGPHAVAVDSNGNVYLSGATDGNLFGTNAGDAFLVKYDSSGNQLWNIQFGTSDEEINGIAIDAQNNVYGVGLTTGSLFGTNASTDPNDLETGDAFIVKYDSNGNQIWGKQFGALGNDGAASVAIDGQGNACVVGVTYTLFGASLGDTDAFLAKFDPNGSLLWGKQFGSSNGDEATAVCVDNTGNIYVGGSINLLDNGGGGDAETEDGFVTKFDANGNQLWSNTLSTPAEDVVAALVLDGRGHLVVGGVTAGNLFGTNAGGDVPFNEDIFVAEYDLSGNIIWGKQYGVAGEDDLSDMCTDGQGSLYLVGHTTGSLFGTNAGDDDAFIQKISSSGQMAMAAKKTSKVAKSFHDPLGAYRSNKHKPKGSLLKFAWAGRSTTLDYPPVLIANQPYMYAGYLCYGAHGTKMVSLKNKGFDVIGPYRHISIRLNSQVYLLNGQTRRMAYKPMAIDGSYYVPLDVVKAVLPLSVCYDSKSRRVIFDPPQVRLARR